MNIARSLFTLVRVVNITDNSASAYYAYSTLYLGFGRPDGARWSYCRVTDGCCEVWYRAGWEDVSDLENHPWSHKL